MILLIRGGKPPPRAHFVVRCPLKRGHPATPRTDFAKVLSQDMHRRTHSILRFLYGGEPNTRRLLFRGEDQSFSASLPAMRPKTMISVTALP
ncbi:hypothetical protein, partial [Treponema socranskii]|uniref:hypothetical protein n=1 Tax=Treponema socranskii TaxID=53419 RepID=UPI003618FC37